MGRINHSFVNTVVNSRIGNKLMSSYARRVFLQPPQIPQQPQMPPQNFKENNTQK